MKKLSFNIFTTILWAALLMQLCSCGNAKTNVNEETEAEAKPARNEEGIAELSADQMKAMDIQLGTIEQQNLASGVRANGQLAVPPQNKAVVNALVGGVIRRINVVEGQQVKKGQVVVSIENPDFIKWQQDYLTSKDNIVYLEQEYERQRILKEADAGIGKVYQQASANFAAEQSKIRTLEAQLRQVHINPSNVRRGNLITQVPVLSPISGTVGKISLSIGTYTDASTPIMEIVNNTSMYCDLQVFEKDIAKVKVGQIVNFTLTNQADKRISGEVYGINKSFEPENKAVVVHAVLNNVAPLNLIEGQYVTALIETGRGLVQAVPKDAVVKANDKTYIFVLEGIEKEPIKRDTDDKEVNNSEVEEKYRFKMIEVATGVEELGYVEIKLIEVLQPNTKIVSKGAFYVYSSMQDVETDDL